MVMLTSNIKGSEGQRVRNDTGNKDTKTSAIMINNNNVISGGTHHIFPGTKYCTLAMFGKQSTTITESILSMCNEYLIVQLLCKK